MDSMDMQDRCVLFHNLKWNWKRSDTISHKRIEEMGDMGSLEEGL